MRPPKSWFVPDDEPILDLLTAQWTTVATTLEAVVTWTRGSCSTSEVQAVLEVGTDQEREERRALHRRVRAAFWTPLDPEDIYELGERIGMLHRQLGLLVREAGASRTTPDHGLADILAAVSAAATPLGTALRILPSDEAASLADDACDRLDIGDDAYGAALALLDCPDARLEINRRELYRRGEHIIEAATRVAHRAWYSVCKIS